MASSTERAAPSALVASKSLLPQRFLDRGCHGVIARLVQRQPDLAHALSDTLGRAQKSRCIRVIGTIGRQSGQAFQGVGNTQMCLRARGNREGLVCVSFSLFLFTLSRGD